MQDAIGDHFNDASEKCYSSSDFFSCVQFWVKGAIKPA